MFGQSSKGKIILLIFFVAFLGVLVFVILMQRGLVGKSTSIQPAGTSSPSQMRTDAIQSDFIPMEDAAKQFEAIRSQLNAGTLSPEEANDQMNNMKIAPPEVTPEMRRKAEEARKK